MKPIEKSAPVEPKKPVATGPVEPGQKRTIIPRTERYHLAPETRFEAGSELESEFLEDLEEFASLEHGEQQAVNQANCYPVSLLRDFERANGQIDPETFYEKFPEFIDNRLADLEDEIAQADATGVSPASLLRLETQLKRGEEMLDLLNNTDSEEGQRDFWEHIIKGQLKNGLLASVTESRWIIPGVMRDKLVKNLVEGSNASSYLAGQLSQVARYKDLMPEGSFHDSLAQQSDDLSNSSTGTVMRGILAAADFADQDPRDEGGFRVGDTTREKYQQAGLSESEIGDLEDLFAQREQILADLGLNMGEGQEDIFDSGYYSTRHQELTDNLISINSGINDVIDGRWEHGNPDDWSDMYDDFNLGYNPFRTS